MAIEDHPVAVVSDRPAIESQIPADAASTVGTRRSWLPGLACCLVYGLLAILLFGHLGSVNGAHVTGPQTVDQVSQLWWIEWANYAVSHGHNLFFTNWQNYPVGLNSEVNLSMLALGSFVSPITHLFGPVVAWDVLVRFAVFASASSMCLVLRRWVSWWPAAFIGGLLYGFSAYETLYGGQVVDLSFVALPPLLFLIVYELMFRQRWRPVRTGVLLGTLLAIQFLISTEVFASSVLLSGIGCLLYLIANWRSVLATWSYIQKAIVATVASGAVLLAYPLYVTFLGPGHINGPPNPPSGLAALHGDLLGLVSPGYLQRFTSSKLNSFWLQHLSNSAMIFVGAPFLIAVVVTVIALRRRGIVLIAGLLSASSLLLSLGSYLYVGGHDTHIPLPFLVLAHLPLTDGFLSNRFSLYTVLFGSAILAMGIEAVYRRIAVASTNAGRPTLWRVVAGTSLAVIIALAVGLPVLPSRSEQLSLSGAPSPAVATALRRIPAGSTVLAYPYPDSPVIPVPFTYKYESIDDVLLDQALTGMNYRLIGSYAWRPSDSGSYGTPGPSELVPHAVQALFSSSFYGFATAPQKVALANADMTKDLREFMRRYHVAAVVVLPLGHSAQAIIKNVTAAIGPPSAITAGATVWYGVQHRLGSD